MRPALTLGLDVVERAVCDELKRRFGLASDRDLVRHALYRLAATDADLAVPVTCFALGEARRRRRQRALAIVLLAAALGGCRPQTDVIVNVPTAPTAPVEVVTLTTIEFRVVGNASSVRIRHVNPVDGLSQVTTVLPYVVTIRTDLLVMFLSLDVTPVSYPVGTLTPFLSAQIFVNGALFREGSSADLFLAPVSVSGTWRK